MLRALIAELPEQSFLERIGLQSRLAEVDEEIARLRTVPQPRPFPVTFRGAPVDGTRAIDAGFAAVALKGLIDAIDVVAASLTLPDLKATGPVPGAGTRGLRIVDTAVGSFGFELELPAIPGAQPVLALGPPEDAAAPEDAYAAAIVTTMTLLEKAAAQDDDAMSDLIADVHPRAAAKIKVFAEILASYDAGFAAEFDSRTVRLASGEDALRVVTALRGEDIHVDEEEHVGALLGVLPESRQFECRLAGGRVVRGKVDRAVSPIQDFKAAWENKNVTLRFRVVTVRSRARYVLLSAAPIPPRS